MKRILLAVTILVLVLPAMRQAEAQTDVSVDFFYDNLSSDGSWVEVADYGYCWQPSIASNSSWRPYSDGYWAYTDVGWTWVSNEDFGWATYHYGRWTRLRDRGWFWVPGREWGPAWVSWRTGGDYVGWAPLPPRGGGEVESDNRPISGQVDVDFDIGPDSYNFVDVRYIGEPVLRDRIVQPNLNITYISNTVNVTNITYTNSTVYNYGPDYNTLSRYSTRPIRRMTLEHEANVDLSVAVRSKGLTRVQGDKLIIAAPLTFQKPSKPIAPKMVKEKIAKPTFEHGWSGVSDPKAQAELKQKMKSENPKNIPPPTIKPRENAETAQSPASASPAPPAPGTTPATAASPAVSAKPAAGAAPAASAGPALTPPGKHKNERGEKPTAAGSPSSSIAPGKSPAPTRNKPSDDRQRISPPITAPSPGANVTEGTPPNASPTRDKGVKDKRTEMAPATPRQPSDALNDKVPRKPKDEPRGVTPAPPNREAPPDAPPKHPVPPERVAPPPGPAANGPVKTEAPRSKRGPDKKTTEPSPSPGS